MPYKKKEKTILDKCKEGSSWTVDHQGHQWTYVFFFQCSLWWAFFTPVTAHFEIDNAFGLGMYTLHALTFYFGLAIFAISAYPIWMIFFTGNHNTRHERAEMLLTWTTGVALLGSALKLVSIINANEGGLFVWYMVGHVLICFALAVTFTIGILITKYIWRDAFALVDILSCISIGLIISIITTTWVHSDNDRFFTKAERALTREFYIGLVQTIWFLLLMIYFAISKCWKDRRDNDVRYEQELRTRGRLRFNERASIGSKFFGKAAQAQPFAIFLVIYFYFILKLPQFASMFWFTESQGDVFVAFFALGSILGTGLLGYVFVALIEEKYRCTQITFEVLFCVAIAFLLGFANYENFWLLCFFICLIGLFLGCLTAIELYKLGEKRDNGTVPFSLSCFGIYGTIVSLLNDKSHYMNRDDPLWTYIGIGLTGVVVIFACSTTLEWCKKGCKCGSCCGCCDPEERETDSD